jgi:lipoprotein-releasing system ATP-binding protein
MLELAHVSRSYDVGESRVVALDDVSLTIGAAEFVAIAGPSGSGKSTLLQIVGLLDRPTAGSIHLAGQDTGRLDDRALTRYRGRTVGFVFQFHHLLPEFSALENVMLPMMANRGRLDASMEECARHLLAEVGLEAHVTKRPGQLSGGQQQRVAIARALAMAPRLVLADEPTGNLDTHAADEVFKLLRAFNRRSGVTFLVVTHDPRLADRCDRIVELVDGRVVGDRPNRRTS